MQMKMKTYVYGEHVGFIQENKKIKKFDSSQIKTCIP